MPRPEIIDWVEQNLGVTECSFYNSMTAGAYGAALASAFTGQFWLTGGLALVGKAAEMTAEAAGCNKPPPPPIAPGAGEDCWKNNENVAVNLEFSTDDGASWNKSGIRCVQILSSEYTEAYPDGTFYWVTRYVNWGGSQGTWNVRYPMMRVRLAATDCGEYRPDGDPPPHNPGEPIADPVTHTDTDGCNWTIQATDAYVDDQGIWHTYYVITADNDACGGPFAYWSSQDGPRWVQPNPINPDPLPPPGVVQCPDPCQPCPDPCPDPCPPIPAPIELPGKTYELTGVCEDVKDGESQPKFEWNIAPDRYERAIAARLDAIALMLQQHLKYRTPTCAPKKPPLEGTWISTRWISASDSPAGERPLRKLLRYRSKSTRTAAELRSHWSGFSWEAGPWCVIHKGAWWGTPQVWASSEDEGKRVLRFAAAEAGLDPDVDGEWIVTSSANPRYGQPGTMRLENPAGEYWVTRRDGPDGLPD